MHFTFKNLSFKKNIMDTPICKEIYIMDSEIHNSKKRIQDPPIRNRIRLPDSAIQKSIIYAKIVSITPPH